MNNRVKDIVIGVQFIDKILLARDYDALSWVTTCLLNYLLLVLGGID